jgi:hypothetical protein
LQIAAPLSQSSLGSPALCPMALIGIASAKETTAFESAGRGKNAAN